MSNYVYMFLNEIEEPLYIGISTRLVQRIETQHFKGKSGNLTKECIEETHKILYHEATSSDDMKIKERYLINTLEPKYNDKMNNRNRFNYNISVNWHNYDFDKKELLKNINERKRSYQTGKTIIRNHRNQIAPIPHAGLPTGICIDVDKNTFFKIKQKGRKDIIFIVVQGELYIYDNKVLGYYYANYKKISREYNLERRKDFIAVITKRELNKHENDIKAKKFSYDDIDGIPNIGLSFIRYESVKKFDAYDEKTISQFDEKLKKITIV